MNQPKSFSLIPIGVLNAKGAIVVEKAYLRGLKQIEHFSHLRILWKRPSEIKTTPHLDGDNQIGLTTVAIQKVDGAKVFLEDSCLATGTEIFDIKPYIPMEDRVKDPSSVSGNSSSNPPSKSATKKTTRNKKQNANHTVIPIGAIEKRDKQWVLSFDTAHKKALGVFSKHSHLNCIWYFNRFDNPTLRKTLICNPPYQAPKTGVFACRAPVRPNPLALSVCTVKKLDQRKGEILVGELEAFPGTPIIGISGYTPANDRIEKVRTPMWISHWPSFIEEQSEEKDLSQSLKQADVRALDIYRDEPKTDIKPSQKPLKDSTRKAARQTLEVVGARQNNLKNISIKIPLGKITVVTGVSGSGKSSLAFDTIFAEGQRRYMRNLLAVSQFYNTEIEKPDVDNVRNLLPAVAIKQKRTTNNPRSTLGSVTDVYSYLRLLFSRLGTRHCTRCGTELLPISVDALTDRLTSLYPNTVISIKAGKVGSRKKLALEITVPAKGVSRQLEEQIRSTVKQCYDSGAGFLTLKVNDAPEIAVTQNDACTNCDAVYFKMTPSVFSYNSPMGMCSECNGLGCKMDIGQSRVITDPDRSLLDGASPWYGNLKKYKQKPSANWMRTEVLALADKMNVDLALPWRDLPSDFRHKAMYGTGDEKLEYKFSSGKTDRTGTIKRPVGGAVNHLRRLLANSRAKNSHELYKTFLEESPCPTCHGERLGPQGRYVTLYGKRYPEVANMTVREVIDWLEAISCNIPSKYQSLADNIIGELKVRLTSLLDVGLYYLSLDRSVTTLSGGESQRIKLAGQLDNGLSGLLYVLDEPSIGLHAKDQAVIIDVMKRLKTQGNTVVVVEHAEEIMGASDYIIDMGKGGGTQGGSIVAAGTPKEIAQHPDSITGTYLKHYLEEGVDTPPHAPPKKRKRPPTPQLTITGASLHNLKKISASFPIGRVSCVTGVSGSGKSSLVGGTLVPALCQELHNMETSAGPFESITGLQNLNKVVHVTQSPIGRSQRSTPATYIGVFDEIRNVFAKSKEAQKRRFKSARFSFNDKVGRCPECEGIGKIKVDMSFLPDAMVTCSDCNGKRYNRETLDVTLDGKSIYDVLCMDVSEAIHFFKDQEKILKPLQIMDEVGLSYLKLGQTATTLSGGEAQRIKLAKELSTSDNGQTLYVLDEPTSGLHSSDIEKLMSVVHHLADLGNTVIIIEHNLAVINSAHHIVDLGPTGGENGGYLVAQGPPSEIMKNTKSATGQSLLKH